MKQIREYNNMLQFRAALFCYKITDTEVTIQLVHKGINRPCYSALQFQSKCKFTNS